MAQKTYRCIVSELNIRTQPGTSNTSKTGEKLGFGQLLNIDDAPANRAELDGFVWVRHSKGWSAERSLDGRFVFLSDAVSPREAYWGINIDPNNPRANPTADQLTGTGWVRFVFHAESRRETLAQAFAFYDPYIRAYHQAGIKVLLVVLQDTYGGSAPWISGADWGDYARAFGQRVGQIAQHYRGVVSAYQVWNEQDLSGQPTSIALTPAHFSLLLLETAKAITLNDPAAQVIAGGLATALGNAITYLREVRRLCGGLLPVDGIAVHPYGHIAPNTNGPFNGWATGQLDIYLNQMITAFPDLPIWITEIGVPRVDVENRSFWPNIATYMEQIAAFVCERYAHAVPVVIWFAWGDEMDRAGIVNSQETPKAEIYQAYFRQVHAAYPALTRPATTPFDGKAGLFHIAGESIPSVESLAEQVALVAPNAQTFLLKATRGLAWLVGRPGALGATSPADLSTWATAFGRHRIVLELNRNTLALGNPTAIRNFMLALRRALPAPYPIGLMFDSVPSNVAALQLAEFLPFIDFWLPHVRHLATNADPSAMLTAMFTAMRNFRKPIVPILEVGEGGQIRAASRLATEGNGAPALLFADALPASDLAIVRSVALPAFAGFVRRRMLGRQTVVSSAPLRARALPLTNAETLAQLAPGQQVEIYEARTIQRVVWVRHDKGWSVAKNEANGDVFLA
jgi:hypothetical protein